MVNPLLYRQIKLLIYRERKKIMDKLLHNKKFGVSFLN